jgi:hypothetical protein
MEARLTITDIQIDDVVLGREMPGSKYACEIVDKMLKRSQDELDD